MKIGDKYEGYKVTLICETDMYGIALVRRDGKDECDFGVIGY